MFSLRTTTCDALIVPSDTSLRQLSLPADSREAAVSRHVESPVLIEPAFIVLKQLASGIY